jgi:competence protein ComEC
VSFSGVFSGRTELGMRHAAVRTLVAAAAGIALSSVASIPLWPALVVVAVAVGLARASRGLALYLAVAAAAFACARAHVPAPVDARPYAAEWFHGVVVPEPSGGAEQRVVVELSAPWHGKVTVWLKDSVSEFRPGDVVRVTGRIRPLDRPRNPGATDYNSVLAARGFVGSANVPAGSITILSRGKGTFLMTRLVMPVRRYILAVIGRVLPGAEGALLTGLLLGGSQGLPKDVQDAFSDAGIVHILAVSGMNVSIVVGIMWVLLSLLGVRRWWRFWIGAAGVGFYVLLVGWSAAPVRAGLMAFAVLLSIPTQRRVTPVATLSVAGICLLFIDPAMLFDVGAQLSFAATMGIALVAGPAEQAVRGFIRARWLNRWVLAPMVVSLAASLATTPLLLHHFSRVQPLAFVTSTVVVPLVGLAMPLGVVVLLASLVSHWLASAFAQSLWSVLFVLLKLTVFMGKLDWAIWEPGRWSWLLVGWVYLLGLLALKLNRSRARAAFAILLLVGLSAIAWQGALRRPETSVTFLDPRQGDAILLEDSLGHKVLFDAGINGTGVLRDYLRSRGIHCLDIVVVTHPDKDHYGGLLDLPERCRIRRLLVPTTGGQDPEYQGLLKRLLVQGTEVVVVGKGTSLSGLGFDVRFIWPDDATRSLFLTGAASTNDLSLVASVAHQGFRMLLTGDLDDPELIAGEDVRADLLKSPHHGSLKGNREVLYERVQPDYVLVMGRYPTPARLEPRFAGTGVRYVNTRVDGAAILRFASGRPILQRPFPRLALPGENRKPTDARSESPSNP